MQINPRLDPDTTHPIVLFEDLYGEDPRAPQTQFVIDRQIAFLEALAVTGSVRAAARRVKVSHQTCYRARRGSAAFGRAWDAALVIARASAEAQLAEWAMHGRREDVWYHGELVGQRTIYSDRLILAHLARLDRKCDDERIAAMAEDFDGLIRRMRAEGEIGEGIEPPFDAQNSVRAEPVEAQPQRSDQATLLRKRRCAPGTPAQPERGLEDGSTEGDTPDSATGENSSSGQWSMRSMSGNGIVNNSSNSVRAEPVEALSFTSSDGPEESSALRQAQGERSEGGEGPPSSTDGPQIAEGGRPTRAPQACAQCGGQCADPSATLTRADCQWFGNRLERMLEARPPYAPDPRELDQEAWDSGLLDEIHIAGFEQGIRKWWMLKGKDAEKVGVEAAGG